MRFAWRLSLCLFILGWQFPVSAADMPSAPEVAAKAWILIDYHSGQVLAAHRAEQPLPPASLTKLAVAYVLFHQLRDGKLKLDDQVTVSRKAAETRGSSMFLRPNEVVRVEELIHGMLVVSANDATVALAERVAGSEAAFVAIMNDTVHALGMTQTHFVTTDGLPATGHVSTAHELATLASTLMREFPEYYSWFSIKEFTHNGIRQYNRNALLWRGADGMKTGQTHEAGFCLVASAKRGDMRLIAVILDAADENARVVAAQELLDYGFGHYETRMLYAARSPVTEVRVWMGNTRALPLGSARDLYLTLPRGWHERAQLRVSVTKDQFAPIKAGQTVGSLSVDLDRESIAEYPLVALTDIPRGNIFQRLADRVQRWFQ